MIVEQRLEPPEPRIVGYCHVCGLEIYDGPIYGKNEEGKLICRDCLDEEWSRLADDEKFEILGYEVVV